MAHLVRLVLAITLALAGPGARAASTVRVVAAENVYGGIAQAIAGTSAEVISVLANPDQDPHLFETAPIVARQIADAQIVIVNGAGYDPWMDKLMAAAPRPGRIVINAAELMGKKEGDNPHLWYDPATMPKVAAAIAGALAKLDPAHTAAYAGRMKST